MMDFLWKNRGFFSEFPSYKSIDFCIFGGMNMRCMQHICIYYFCIHTGVYELYVHNMYMYIGTYVKYIYIHVFQYAYICTCIHWHRKFSIKT